MKHHRSSMVRRPQALTRDQRGVSLIEVIVALGALALLALVSLPLFASALKLSTDGATDTGAGARVQAVIERMRETPVNCGKLTNLSLPETYENPRGDVITVSGRLIAPPAGGAACNAGSPNAQSVPVEISAVRERDEKKLISIRTNIFVTAGS